jgi:hypothetical protein
MRQAALFVLTILLLCSCAGRPQAGGTAALFAYEDFGPPAMADELLGMDWPQWQAHGDSRPAKYDIKVVVYRNVGLDQVKKQYPVVPEQNKDYRYVEYAQAIRYLDSNIAENALASLTERLKATKAKIVQQLGPP